MPTPSIPPVLHCLPKLSGHDAVQGRIPTAIKRGGSQSFSLGATAIIKSTV